MFKPPFCQVGSTVWIPYSMFPCVYSTGQNKSLGVYRENTRKLKILFAGNTSKTYYNNSKLKIRYNQLTRIEAVNTLSELRDNVKFTKGKEGFENLINTKGYINGCRILLTDAKFPICPVDWLKLLSTSDFFICLSGTDYPICHNAIEAMAVGAIPIISYHDWFFPSLEHNKNAIVYSGKEDLVKKIEEVINMSAEQIEVMRRNVIEYYERHLTTESFINKFELQAEQVFTLMLHPRLVCQGSEEEAGKALYGDLQLAFDLDNSQGTRPESVKVYENRQ